MSIYMDYNASAPIDQRVLKHMIDVYQNSYGNADSRTHNYGEAARAVVESARSKIAKLAGCNANELFFTSGATESNNLVFQGLVDYAKDKGKKHIIVSMIEHKAILETVRHMETLGFEVDYVAPQANGRILEDDIYRLIRDDTLIVSIMHVNNETGVIQPVETIGETLSNLDLFFHVDATQSFGKLIDEVRNIKYDFLSISAHKLSGPQGVGGLIIKRKNYKLPQIKPILFGGPQEHGIRPGTLPVALIAGFGKACEIAENDHSDVEEHCLNIKSGLLKLLEDSGLEYEINGSPEFSIFNTLNIRFTGISSEALMIACKDCCGISNGSACTSNDYTPSYVLRAMGIPDEHIMESVRISWGPEQDSKEVLTEFGNLLDVAKMIR